MVFDKVKELIAEQLDVDAEAVGEEAHLPDQLRACAGDGLGMDIAAEMVFVPQQPQDGEHPFGGVVRRAQYRAGKEQPFNVVAAVKLHGQLTDLIRRKRCPLHIIGAPVQTIPAVKNTLIGK